MGGFRLGSIFGIEIRIDYSWLVIFFLVLWTLTWGVFPAARPGQETAVYVGMGIAGTLLLFASLLAHELSHSLVARRKGMEVEGITLFIFGGMARTGSEFENPGDEFVVAGIGPVSSLIMAGLFWLVARGGAQLDWPVAVTGVASYLALINLVLAVFNLFPGFPLDGGRLFRAIVWKRTGDPRRATRVATNGGRILGYLLMGMGLVNLFSGNPLGGLWLLFIGWFVRSTAEASYAQYVLRASLAGVRTRDAMTREPQTVPPDLTLQRFLEDHVLEGRHHSYPVMEGGRPIGLITLERVRLVPKNEWPRSTVRDAMLPLDAGLAVRPEDSMIEVLDKLSRSQARRLLVADGDRLVGIISQTDVARWLDRERLREEIAP